MFISGLFKPLSRDGNQKGSGVLIDFWVIILLFATSHSLDLNCELWSSSGTFRDNTDIL